MKTTDFKKGDRVIYVPNHAQWDNKHPDRMPGTVSSTNSSYVFVKFDQQLKLFGWDGTTAQTCSLKNIERA